MDPALGAVRPRIREAGLMLESFDDFFFTYQSLIYGLGVNGLLALSMYVVLSVGQLSLGQAAFMGIGAYVSSLLTLKLEAPFAAALAAGMIAPALLAALIGVPTLRLSGVYLALATIGLGEVLRIFYLNSDMAGSALGLPGIPHQGGAWMIYMCLAVALALSIAIGRSRVGRAMEAIREDETAAGIMGVNVPLYRFAALVASAVLAGLAGALSADATSFIGPNEYGFDQAVTILSFALLGGIGSPFGPVVGAFILTLLPEVLRPLHDFRFVVNGLIIVIAVLYLPRGIVSWRLPRTGPTGEARQ
jgi:branched-chain amino acid transport system permease protein